MRYEEIDHTADVGIRAYGRTLGELFANAAEGMFSLIAELDTVKPVGEIEIRLTAEDPPTLLLRWLSELLYVHETRHLLFAAFDVNAADGSLQGRARGEADLDLPDGLHRAEVGDEAEHPLGRVREEFVQRGSVRPDPDVRGVLDFFVPHGEGQTHSKMKVLRCCASRRSRSNSCAD